MAVSINLGMGAMPGTYAAVAPGPVPLVSVPDVTRPPSRPFTPIAPLAPIGPEFGTDRATAIRERMARRPAPAAGPASVAQAAPAAEPDAPRAEAPVVRSSGGLGGLGGLSFGDHISALGMSLMTGGGGNYLGNYPQALENIRTRRREEAELARTRQGVTALGRALGFSDEEIAQTGYSLEVVKAIAQQRQQQAARARAEAMIGQMSGMPSSQRPAAAQAPAASAPDGSSDQPPLGFRVTGGEGQPSASATAPSAPASTPAPAADPYANITAMNAEIGRLEAAAKAFEDAGDSTMAGALQAQADARSRERDFMIDRLPPVQGATNDMIEYDAAVAQGYEGSLVDFLNERARNRAASVNVSTGTVPSGYAMETDDQGRPVRMVLIPGGPAAVERESTATQALVQADNMLSIIDEVIGHPSREDATGMSGFLWTLGTQGAPGGGIRNFNSRLMQLEGQTFLQAFESLKGGGQITQIEGEKAERAIAALDRFQDDESFLQALQDLREVVMAARERAARRLGQQSSPPSPPPSSVPAPQSRGTSPRIISVEPVEPTQ